MTLEPFAGDLFVGWHVFQQRGWRGMLETHIKDGRHKVTMQIFGPRKPFRPSGIGVFGFASYFPSSCRRRDGGRGTAILGIVVVVIVLFEGSRIGSFPSQGTRGGF